MSIFAYLRVSGETQDYKNQRYEILNYAETNKMKVDEWIELEISSRKSNQERRIDELREKLQRGDTLISTELARLGRSISQIVLLVDELLIKGVRLVLIKQGIDIQDSHNITSKTMITMFALMAEVERDLISERTKMGLARAKAQGRVGGRKKGQLAPSRLDPHREEIITLLKMRVPKSELARKYEVQEATLYSWLKTRKIRKEIKN